MNILNSFGKLPKGVAQTDVSQSDLELLLQAERNIMAADFGDALITKKIRPILEKSIPCVSIEILNLYIQGIPEKSDQSSIACILYGAIVGEAASKLYEQTKETTIIDGKGVQAGYLLAHARNADAVIKNVHASSIGHFAGSFGGYAKIVIDSCPGDYLGWYAGSNSGNAILSITNSPGTMHGYYAGGVRGKVVMSISGSPGIHHCDGAAAGKGNAFITISKSPGKNQFTHAGNAPSICVIETDSNKDRMNFSDALVLYRHTQRVGLGERESGEHYAAIKELFDNQGLSASTFKQAKRIFQ